MEYYKNLSLESLFYINDDGLVYQEEWKGIKYYEDRYQISTLGRVKTLNYNKTKEIRILKQGLGSNGYLTVSLYKLDSKLTKTVHSLVAKTFILNSKNKSDVNHIGKDGNKTKNIVSNLEWATESENSQHSYDNNLSKAAKGESYKSKLNEWQVIEIRNTNTPFTHKQLAVKYGISRVTITDILRRKSWKHI
jgi:hypothetical protein